MSEELEERVKKIEDELIELRSAKYESKKTIERIRKELKSEINEFSKYITEERIKLDKIFKFELSMREHISKTTKALGYHKQLLATNRSLNGRMNGNRNRVTGLIKHWHRYKTEVDTKLEKIQKQLEKLAETHPESVEDI